ncbi:MAG: hypothetical protein ACREBU_04205, partial [Nitrososphaera sp.]
IGSGSLVFFLTVVYNDFYNQPAIVVEAPRVEAAKDGVSTTFTVRNEGRAPANNLRLTISTTDKIIDHRLVSNDEEISLTQPSSMSIIGQIPRLTENAEVAVFATVNATEKDSLFKITLTFDAGSAKYIYSISDPVLEAERALSLSIIAAIFSGSIAIAGFLLSLRTTRFGTSETSKSEYRASETITILGKVKSSQEESVILISNKFK